jgi:tetratricopeptide (TPR) repeat protein
MRRYLLLFLLIGFYSNPVYSQYALTDSLLSIIRSDAPDSVKIDAVNSIGFNIYTPDSALYYAKVIIAEGQRQHNDQLIALGWAHAGYSYSRSSDQPQALKAELLALKVAERTNNPVVLVAIYENMGFCYAYIPAKRMEYERKAAAITEHTPPNFFYAVALGNFAASFADNHQVDSALNYAERAYVIDVTKGHGRYKSFLSRTLGEIHQLMNDNVLAFSYYRTSLDNCLSTHDPKGLYFTYRDLGDYYEHLHSADSALFYYRKSFLIVGETKTANYYIMPAQWLYAYFKQKGRADSALFYLEKVTAAEGSVDAIRKAVGSQSISFEEDLRQQEMTVEKERQAKERTYDLQLAVLFIAILAATLSFLLLSRSIIVSHKVIYFLSVLVLLIFFEFINLLLHPILQKVTNDSPVLLLLSLVAIGAIIVPIHHRLEKWATNRLVEKNKAIRLAKARKTIRELEKP